VTVHEQSKTCLVTGEGVGQLFYFLMKSLAKLLKECPSSFHVTACRFSRAGAHVFASSRPRSVRHGRDKVELDDTGGESETPRQLCPSVERRVEPRPRGTRARFRRAGHGPRGRRRREGSARGGH
jgi:hypothetical protein